MSKKRPDYLRLIVDNGKRIQYENYGQELIIERINVQKQISDLKRYEQTLIDEYDNLIEEIKKIERRANYVATGPRESTDVRRDGIDTEE